MRKSTLMSVVFAAGLMGAVPLALADGCRTEDEKVAAAQLKQAEAS